MLGITKSVLGRWESQHLDIEIGLALESDRWAGADYWRQAADPILTLGSLLERSEVVIMGVDGGCLDDLLGLAAQGRDKRTGQWLLWSRAWANSSVPERCKGEVSALRDFEEDGDLVLCSGFDPDIGDVVEIACRINRT